MDMLQATEEVKKIEELRLAYILRVANHSENMDKDLAKLHHESYGKCITEKEVKKLNDLQKIGGI